MPALPPSLFCKGPVTEMSDFKWDCFSDELRSKAPTLFQVLFKIASRNDHRNEHKCGCAHNAGICIAAAIILKERNREMCGVQSIISLLLFSSHVDKQVGENTHGANNHGRTKIKVTTTLFPYLKQVYARLNHASICMSYSATLKLTGEVSQMHHIPIQEWIK